LLPFALRAPLGIAAAVAIIAFEPAAHAVGEIAASRLDVPAFAVTAGYSGEPPLDSRYVMPLSFNFGFFLH
jgi:hypothetical protein